jgi:hypothetical protein
MYGEFAIKRFNARRVDICELKMDYRPLLPLPVCFGYGEAIKQLTPSHEDFLQGGDHERLAEPTRTGKEQKPVHLIRDKAVEIRRFIDVYAAILYKIGKIARRCRYRFHLRIL